MKRRWIFRTILFLLLAAGAAATFVRYRAEAARQAAHSGEGVKAKPPVVANMVMPRRMTLRDERFFSGTTRAWSSYDVESKVAGKLEKLTVDIDSILHQGDLIAKIDDTEYQQAVDQAHANLELARAQYDESKIMTELRLKEFNRQSELRDARATTAAQFESAESSLKAQRAVEKMRLAEVRRQEALLANAELKLKDCTIHAVWNSGSERRYIGERYIDEGTLLAVGKPIVQIIEIDRIKVYIPVIERDYRFLRENQDVEITVDAKPGKIYRGKVSNIANSLSENTRNAWVVVAIPNDKLELRPGMFARARVVLSVHENAQVVPVDAVLTKNGRQGVFLFDAATGTARFVPVETGLAAGKMVEIMKPENINVPVITVGSHLLNDGAPVRISELSRNQMIEARYREKPAAAPANGQGSKDK